MADKLSLADLREQHQNRSKIARETDEALFGEITQDKSEWAAAPGEFDYPGIDTPAFTDEELDAGAAVAGFTKDQADREEFEGDTTGLGGTLQGPLAAASATGDDRPDLSSSQRENLAAAVRFVDDEVDDPADQLDGFDRLRKRFNSL